MPTTKPILLFDGVCNLCNGAVQFILKRDPKGNLLMASLQSEVGQGYLKKFGLDSENFDTFILIEDDKYYTRSTAALRVAKRLKGLWPLMYMFIIIPAFIRNAVYSFVAKRRYKWFGKREVCMFPTPEMKKRFLDEGYKPVNN